MEVNVLHVKSGKVIATLTDCHDSNTLHDVKLKYQNASGIQIHRQSFRFEQRGKSLQDSVTLKSLGFVKHGSLYFKDLGPQIGWTTVFLSEYAGPLLIYLVFYCRPAWIYGKQAYPIDRAVQLAAMCWTAHYGKRLLETVFIHRFSHATMPLFNLFKNCSYYWGFTMFVSYYVNHPLYTSPMYGDNQIYLGFALFLFGELGNLSTHLALRDLRPSGTLERKIPYPNNNPFTYLFSLVSCPNYTYEFISWLGFSILSQSLPAVLFTTAGVVQMSIWALNKHRAYKKEFPSYPRGRRAIIPFLL